MPSPTRGLGLQLLRQQRRRLLLSCVGVGVAVCIMFTQIGFLDGLLESQALIATRTQGDLVMLDRARTHLHKWARLEPVRLHQAGAVRGVADVIPVYQTTAGLRNPDTQAVRRILVTAFPAERPPLAIGDPATLTRLLSVPGSVLIDRRSRPIYPRLRPGDNAELNGLDFRVGGDYALGPDIVHDGGIVMSDASFLARFPESQPIMGVIRLAAGADRAAVRRALAAALPADVSLFTPAELRRREIRFTLNAAPLGILFGIGVAVGLIIGAVACYQVLFNEINDQLRQYATLKAMGFDDGAVRRVVLEQAALIAAGGYALGLALAGVVNAYIAARTALPVAPGAAWMATVLALTLLMCTMAGLLAYRRVQRLDPAELF